MPRDGSDLCPSLPPVTQQPAHIRTLRARRTPPLEFAHFAKHQHGSELSRAPQRQDRTDREARRLHLEVSHPLG
jgi:hypothetical protein